MTQNQTAYSGWAICEQMGFKKRVGKISEVEMYGAKMLRIDLPVFNPNQIEGSAWEIIDWVTEFAGGPSIYNITPVSEAVGIDLARQRGDPRPVMPVDYRLEHKPEPPPYPRPEPAPSPLHDSDFDEVEEEQPF